MTDSTDTQALSSAPNTDVAVAEPLAGMLVAGYMVLVFTADMDKPPVMYGAFDNLDKALDWAELLTGVVSVHPLYNPTHNRG